VEYFLGSLITLVVLFFIAKIFYNTNKTIVHKNKFRYSQSHIHSIVSPFLGSLNIEKKKVDKQSIKHYNKNNLRVIIVDGEAFWVRDNVFYSAQITPEGIDDSTTKVVDIISMDKVQLDKMLFIIDQLNDGKKK
jgi:hypothetical protein